MTIDSKQFQRDAKALQKARLRRKGPSTMAAVRAVLPAIYALRADGVLWSEIATALGNQGITQGKGKKRIPITTGRLTALVRQIEKQSPKTSNETRQASKKSKQLEDPIALQSPAVSLALDLDRKVENADGKSTPSEEDLRHAALDKIQSVLRKD